MSFDIARPVDQRDRPHEATEYPRVAVPKKRRPVLAYAGAAWLILIVILAATASLLPIADYSVTVGPPRQPPSFASLDLLLGTDNLGRSILSRIIYGARVSLLVGVVAGLLGLVVGSGVGIVSGYLRGPTDRVTTLLVDALLAFPPLVLLLSIAAVLTPSISTLLIGMTVLVVPAFVRLGRSSAIATSSQEYVRAAVNMGASRTRILVKEILPNVISPVLAFLPVVMATLIVAEGSLSFLGLGIPPPQPSWGGSISEGKDSLDTAPFLVAVPSIAVFLTVFALNHVGDHLRAKFDPSRKA